MFPKALSPQAGHFSRLRRFYAASEAAKRGKRGQTAVILLPFARQAPQHSSASPAGQPPNGLTRRATCNCTELGRQNRRQIEVHSARL